MQQETIEKSAPKKSRVDGESPPSRFRIPISAVLIGGFSLIVLLAAVAVYVVFEGGRTTTVRLVTDRNERIVDSIVDRIQNHLEPARAQVYALAQLVGAGELDPSDRKALGDHMRGALGAMHHVTAISYVFPDFRSIRVERGESGIRVVDQNLSGFPNVRENYERSTASPAAFWGELIHNPQIGLTLANVRMPVRRDGVAVGVVASLVSVVDLSRHLTDPSLGAEANTFILHGRNHVLAHPALENPRPEINADKPLLRIDEIGDPILAAIWSGRQTGFIRFGLFKTGEGHVSDAEGRRWVFLTRLVPNYGDQVWIVGRYFPYDDIREDTSQLARALPFGAAAILLAIVVAVLVGRTIGRPIRRLAAAADQVSHLDFEGDGLPRSRLTEIDQANDAYNRSREALRIFGAYVPKKIVWRLLALGAQGTHSKRRVISVLFTDIVGFTTLAESLDDRSIADFLNAHFALVAAAVEAEDGTIDKFIGDAVMATWGAIERQLDHADRACRAARRIAEALREDNKERLARGERPVRLRIGVHSGPVVVGNIGAPGRINYTVVGDTVNTAQRLEDLGRRIAPDDDVVALASADTMAILVEPIDAPSAGRHELRGRNGGLDVFRLA